LALIDRRYSPKAFSFWSKVAAQTVEGDDFAKRSKRALQLKANLTIAAGEEEFWSHGRDKKND
jgi:hypothetical protein